MDFNQLLAAQQNFVHTLMAIALIALSIQLAFIATVLWLKFEFLRILNRFAAAYEHNAHKQDTQQSPAEKQAAGWKAYEENERRYGPQK